jgi:hypothetical protein
MPWVLILRLQTVVFGKVRETYLELLGLFSTQRGADAAGCKTVIGERRKQAGMFTEAWSVWSAAGEVDEVNYAAN